jgi:hypothetical protein
MAEPAESIRRHCTAFDANEGVLDGLAAVSEEIDKAAVRAQIVADQRAGVTDLWRPSVNEPMAAEERFAMSKQRVIDALRRERAALDRQSAGLAVLRGRFNETPVGSDERLALERLIRQAVVDEAAAVVPMLAGLLVHELGPRVAVLRRAAFALIESIEPPRRAARASRRGRWSWSVSAESSTSSGGGGAHGGGRGGGDRTRVAGT